MDAARGYTIPDYESSRFSVLERAGYSKMRILVGDLVVVDMRISVVIVYMIALDGNKRPLG